MLYISGYRVTQDFAHPARLWTSQPCGYTLRTVSNRVEVVIGNKGADHVSLQIARHDPEGWCNGNIEVRCNHLAAKINGTFHKGELSRFAQEIRRLCDDLSGTAQLQPLEPNIALTLKGDGKGHITVEGVARQDGRIPASRSNSRCHVLDCWDLWAHFSLEMILRKRNSWIVG